MIKKIVFLALFFSFIFLIFRFELITYSPFVVITNSIKVFYKNSGKAVGDYIDAYLNQANSIRDLKQQNETLKEERQVINSFANEVIKLSKMINYDSNFEPKVKTVRVISYASLPDFQKVWIDYNDENLSGIKGLVYNNETAGIVIGNSYNGALALLNGDPKCSYAVVIGDKKVTGIVMGKNPNEMIVRYIPAWVKVNIGDDVETSGLDGIFFAGVKVGVVKEVYKLNAYQEAVIKPYYNSTQPDYFYLVERVR